MVFHDYPRRVMCILWQLLRVLKPVFGASLSIVTPQPDQPQGLLTYKLNWQQPTTLPDFYGMSDVHLDNHGRDLPETVVATVNRHFEIQKTRRPHFIIYLQKMLKEVKKGTPVVLVLNGDIVDITGSWPADGRWDPRKLTREARTEKVAEIVQSIVENHPKAFKLLKKLCDSPNFELIYLFGNHDRWMADSQAQKVFKQALGLSSESDKVKFDKYLYVPGLELLAFHGDDFDSNCRLDAEGLSLSDRVEMNFINVLPEWINTKLQQDFPALDPQFVKEVNQVLTSLEYVRPITKVPIYIKHRLWQLYQNSPEISPEVINMVYAESMLYLAEALGGVNHRKANLIRVSLAAVRRFKPLEVVFEIVANMLNLRLESGNKRQYLDVRKLILNQLNLPALGGIDLRSIRFFFLGHNHVQDLATYPANHHDFYLLNAGAHKETVLLPEDNINGAAKSVYPASMIRFEFDIATQKGVVEKISKERSQPFDISVSA
jgi:UDP-2,3-diacylglucosamine pyrophosphatase LpxH